MNLATKTLLGIVITVSLIAAIGTMREYSLTQRNTVTFNVTSEDIEDGMIQGYIVQQQGIASEVTYLSVPTDIVGFDEETLDYTFDVRILSDESGKVNYEVHSVKHILTKR
jgi:hypothetical protein